MGFFGGLPSFSAPAPVATPSFVTPSGGLQFPSTPNVSGFASPTQTPFAAFGPAVSTPAPVASTIPGGGAVGGGLGGFEGALKSIGQLAGAFSSRQQGSNAALIAAQQKAAAFEANAALFDMDAQAFLQAGQLEKERELSRSQRRLAEARSKFLKSGVVLEGTPLVVLGDIALEGGLEAELALHEAQVRAQQSRNKATVERFNAQQALLAGSLLANG